MFGRVMAEVILPTVRGMAAEGNAYTGFLRRSDDLRRGAQGNRIQLPVRRPETQPIMVGCSPTWWRCATPRWTAHWQTPARLGPALRHRVVLTPPAAIPALTVRAHPSTASTHPSLTISRCSTPAPPAGRRGGHQRRPGIVRYRAGGHDRGGPARLLPGGGQNTLGGMTCAATLAGGRLRAIVRPTDLTGNPHAPTPTFLLDRVITEADSALRTVTNRGHAAGRPSPSSGHADTGLSAQERRHVAGLMRVNHTGEVCAQALYQARPSPRNCRPCARRCSRRPPRRWITWCGVNSACRSSTAGPACSTRPGTACLSRWRRRRRHQRQSQPGICRGHRGAGLQPPQGPPEIAARRRPQVAPDSAKMLEDEQRHGDKALKAVAQISRGR